MALKKILSICSILLFLSISVYSVDFKGNMNKIDELPDVYKEKQVTVSENSITIEELLKKLSADTGLKLIAGEDGDWRVRERKIKIFAKNAYISPVMYSIADVTKFYWIPKDKDTYILAFNKDTDKIIAQLEDSVMNAKAADKDAAINDMLNAKNGEDLAKLRKDDPVAYLMRSTGLDKSLRNTLNSNPAMYKSIIRGEKRTFKGNDISSDTIKSINDLNNSMLDIATGVFEDRNAKVPGFFAAARNNEIPNDNSRVEIDVNSDINMGGNNSVSSSLLNSVFSGYAIVKVDGKMTGVLPILDNKSTLAQKVASVLNDLMENPNMTLESAMAQLMTPEMLVALSMDVKRSDDIYKMPIPFNPYFANEIDLGKSPESLNEALDLFSKAVKAPAFCDDFVSSYQKFPFLKKTSTSVRQYGTIYDVLTDICDSYDLNVEVANGQFDFYNIRWFDHIKNVMSNEILDRWAKEYKETGTISFVTLCQMGNFSSEQLGNGFGQRDELRQFIKIILPKHNVLEMLAIADGDSLQKMTTADGMNSAYLNRPAFDKYRGLYQVSKFVNRTNVKIKLKSEQSDNSKYTLDFIAMDNNENISVDFIIPKYVAKQ